IFSNVGLYIVFCPRLHVVAIYQSTTLSEYHFSSLSVAPTAKAHAVVSSSLRVTWFVHDHENSKNKNENRKRLNPETLYVQLQSLTGNIHFDSQYQKCALSSALV
ncbi:hypothetical protein L9F63_006090, partial [Diploptera punctata]